MTDREGAVPVLNDPQFGLTAILRPYAGFDTQPSNPNLGRYQGQSGDQPIMFTEGGVALDPAAAVGQAGYSNRLIKGLSMPLGARVAVWVPSLSILNNGSNDVFYNWIIVWRMRNVFDYRQTRIPFHYPKQGVGTPSTVTGDAGPRVVIPAALECVAVNAPGEASNLASGAAIASVTAEFMQPSPFRMTSPLIPPVTGVSPPPFTTLGVWAQGLFDPASTAGRVVPYVCYELQAKGDELLIGVRKQNGAGNAVNWDFTSLAQDQIFSAMFGSGDGSAVGITGNPLPDVGVFIQVGVST